MTLDLANELQFVLYAILKAEMRPGLQESEWQTDESAGHIENEENAEKQQREINEIICATNIG